MKKAELFFAHRKAGEVSESCRGQYVWTKVRKRTHESRKAGPCYRIDPVTGQKTLITK